MNNLIQSLTAYTTSLEQKLSALEMRVGSLQLTIDGLQLTVNRLQAENESLKAELANLSTINVQLSTDAEPEIEVELIMEDEQEELDGLDTLDIVEETKETTEPEPAIEPIIEAVVEPVTEPVVEAVVEPVVVPIEPTPQPVVEVAPVVESAPVIEKPAPRPIPQQTSLFGTAVEDIRQAISLGDRFLFQRELFAGNGELMQKTLDEINGLDSFDEAMEYVQNNFEWDKESTAVQLFENVLKRRFA